MQLENNFTCICSVPQLQEVTDVEDKQSHSPGEDALSKEGSATSSKKRQTLYYSAHSRGHSTYAFTIGFKL